MKVLIDIPEDEYNEWGKNIKNAIPIPDNATNGDVIKAMFPKDVKVITQHDDIFGRRFIDLRVGQLDCELDDEWWNSPYQKGGK